MTLPDTLAQPPLTTTHDLLAIARQLHDSRSWSPEEAGCRAALVREPDDARAMHRLGLMARAMRLDAEAAAWLRAADAAQPGQAEVQSDLAHALRQAGMHEEAARHFERAALSSPNDANLQLKARLQRGVMHDEAGRAQQALECYLEAVRHHPESADAWAALGMVQLHLLGAEAATPSLQRALQIDPGRLDVMEKFGDVLQEQRRFEDASLVFERLLQRQPDRPLTAGRLMHAKMLGADWTALDRLQQRHRIGHRRPVELRPPSRSDCRATASQPDVLMQVQRSSYAATYLHAKVVSARLAPATARPRPEDPHRLRGGGVPQPSHLGAADRSPRTPRSRSRFEVVLRSITGGATAATCVAASKPAQRKSCPSASLEQHECHDRVRARARNIDILVNLNGYFGLRAAITCLLLRPAPIQVNYLGFPGTTGMRRTSTT